MLFLVTEMAGKNFTEIYEEAITNLGKNIKNSIDFGSGKITLIVTVPRKGPRLIDFLLEKYPTLFKKDEEDNENILQKALVCSEHSLPFLFADKKLAEKISRVVIVDDAVYYGTTITGVYNLVQTYKTITSADFEIKALAGIKDTKANIGKINFEFYEGIPEYFGHYYIKRLSKDLGSLNSTLEIEFPTFSYTFTCPEIPDIQALLSECLKGLPGCTGTYIVKGFDKKRSVTALFDSKDNPQCSFRKCRFNIRKSRDNEPGSYQMKVTVMSPFVLPGKISELKNLFEAFPEIQEAWTTLTDNAMPVAADQWLMLKEQDDSSIMFNEIERLRKRSIVIAANYIISALFFMQIKDKLENCLKMIAHRFEGLNVTDFHYIFGDCSITRRLLDVLQRMIEGGGINDIDSQLRLYNAVPDPERMVFEKNYPQTPYTLPLFQIQVDKLVSRSANIAEAISALFFLQNGLIEKHTRKQEQFNYYRLFFGQTFASIRQFVNKDKFQKENIGTEINRMVDLKIDQCNVVPQYILDDETQCWRRVFRPGENEDYYLSQMARFVIMVHKELAGLWGIYDLPEYLFEDFLILLTYEYQNELGNDLCIKFFKDNNGKLLFRNRESGESVRVLTYLKQMNILEITNKFVRISETLADESIAEVTTLDRVCTEKPIKVRIGNLVETINRYKYGMDTAYMVLNAYTMRIKDMRPALKELKKVAEDMVAYLELIKNSVDENKIKKSRIMIHNFWYFSHYLADPTLVDNPTIRDFEEKLSVCKELYNLAISIYLYKSPKIAVNLLNNWKSRELKYPKGLTEALQTDFQAALANAETIDWIMESIKKTIKSIIEIIRTVKKKTRSVKKKTEPEKEVIKSGQYAERTL